MALTTEEHFAEPPAVARTNLPRRIGTFHGRAAELDHLAALIAPGVGVTVVGAGGVGKTTLAVRVASLTSRFSSTWFVDLSLANDDDQVGALVEAGVEHATDALVVLDNCEHVVAGARDAADNLRAQGVAVVATSRVPLCVDGEVVIELDGLTTLECVDLFRQRARVAAPERVMNDDATLARLVEELDRLPLAVELAAGRSRLMSPAEILERLADHRVLATDDDGAPLRHRSLSATIAWTVELLNHDDQFLLAALSVFRSSFDIGTIDGLFGELGRDADGIVASLDRFVVMSLVHVADERGTTRYSLLETVRHFANTLLRAEGRERAVKTALFRWGHRVADASYYEEQSGSTDDTLRRNFDNVLAVLEWAIDERELRAEALGLATDLWPVGVNLCRGRDARTALLAALSVADEAPSAEMARALQALGTLETSLGLTDEAQRHYESALEMRCALDDRVHEANVLGDLGVLHIRRDDVPAAFRYLRLAAEIHEAVGNEMGLAITLTNLGDLERRRGERSAASLTIRRAMTLWSSLGATRYEAICQLIAASLDFDTALLGRCIETFRELNDVNSLADALNVGAEIAAAQRDHRRVLYLVGADRSLRGETAPTDLQQQEMRAAEERARAGLRGNGADNWIEYGRTATLDEVVAAALGQPLRPKASDGGNWINEGPTWRISWNGETAHLPAIKGLRYLAVLLDRPGTAVNVLDLVRAVEGTVVEESGLDPAVDETARAAYTARLADLETLIERAARRGNLARVEELENERAAISAELQKGFGLGGRARPTAGSSERARKATTNRINEALRRVHAALPVLGAHLAESVTTGRTPTYNPPFPVHWTVVI